MQLLFNCNRGSFPLPFGRFDTTAVVSLNLAKNENGLLYASLCAVEMIFPFPYPPKGMETVRCQRLFGVRHRIFSVFKVQKGKKRSLFRI